MTSGIQDKKRVFAFRKISFFYLGRKVQLQNCQSGKLLFSHRRLVQKRKGKANRPFANFFLSRSGPFIFFRVCVARAKECIGLKGDKEEEKRGTKKVR